MRREFERDRGVAPGPLQNARRSRRRRSRCAARPISNRPAGI